MTLTQPATRMPEVLAPDRLDALSAIARRALALTARMIWEANHRSDADATDPKVGGHPAACASSLHLATALHMIARQPQDFWCAKPHLAPLDHALHFLAGEFHNPDGTWMDADVAEGALHRLRKFSQNGEPVFQSYHADADPDSWRILPSGTVGIPPVNSGYLALTRRYLVDHGLEKPQDVRYWSLLGDSEFREGSLMEAITDFAERGLKEVVWILDYNRQSLDGTRIPNNAAFLGTDADRIEGTMRANGWEVIQLRHGPLRRRLFTLPGGESLRKVLERGLTDYEMQTLLWKRDAEMLKERLLRHDRKVKSVFAETSDEELLAALDDFGGHDLGAILSAYEAARRSERPVMIIAHTLKGWGLESRAMPGNHSTVPDEAEITRLLEAEGLALDERADAPGNWEKNGAELRLLAERRATWRAGVDAVRARVAATRRAFEARLAPTLPLPPDLGISLAMTPLAHSQWMIGQVAGKWVRIATDDDYRAAGRDPGKALSEEEARWSVAADAVLTISPDVGTSTNINPTMDGKIYGAVPEQDHEEDLGLSERGRPHLYSTSDPWTRHIRFEIAEAAAMSAAGSFGASGKYFGVPLMPLMTVYDFFIKRALDQFYYNAYWRSGFVVVGTPSGVTLSPEGAQHSWKSDIQMPSSITWEPFFAREVEWILAETLRRQVCGENDDRSAVILRGVTRGARQKDFMARLQSQTRFAGQNEEEILAATRADVLAGGYWLQRHDGASDYQPGENVVCLMSMGAPTTEALEASDRLKELGVYADVLVVTCADLLLGRFAARDGYAQLKRLGLDGAVHLVATAGPALDAADAVLLGARKVPVVAVVDGEPGLLDNAGSILGVRQLTLAVEKFTKSGRPSEVYAYQGFSAEQITRACGRVLAESAMTEVRLSRVAAEALAQGHAPAPPSRDWRELWPWALD
ncbi:MAG: pyruvate dehydrogenase [Planctomycetota bacterium]|nr:pyruvate dehydrogenase [Planctomycetota bacterium]